MQPSLPFGEADQPTGRRISVDFLAGLIGMWAFNGKPNKAQREAAHDLAVEFAQRIGSLTQQ